MATNQVSAQARGIVVLLKGNAWLESADGSRKLLQLGDEVQEGQKVITENGAVLELGLPNNQQVTVASERELLIDATLLGTTPIDKTEASLQNLNTGAAEVAKIIAAGGDLSSELEPAAAGLAGGDPNESHSFVQLLRISESLDSLSIDRAAAPFSEQFVVASTVATAVAPELSHTSEPIPTSDPTPLPTVAVADTYLTNSNTAVTLNPLGNDSDPQGQTLTLTSINGVALTGGAQTITVDHGVVNVTAAGAISFTPATNYVGSSTFSYGITDASGQTASANDTVTVGAQTPVAVADTYLTNSNTAVTLNPLVNDSDPQGQTLTLTSINGVALTGGAQAITVDHGVVNVTAAGAISFTPTTNYVGSSTFSYGITDASGQTASANETVTVVSITLAHTPTSDTGSSSTDGITANTHPVNTGTGEPNSTVTVTIDPDHNPQTANAIYSVTTDKNGLWNLDLSTAIPVGGTQPISSLPEGTVGLSVTSTDAAGNSATATNTFVEDLRVPAATLTLSTPAVPTLSDGLVHDVWSAHLTPYNSGAGVSSTTLENAIDGFVSAATPTASSSVLTTGVAQSSVGVDSPSLTHGLIYLSANTTYTFNSTADDSYVVEIGGKVVNSATWGANAGATVTGSITPTASGWYTVEVYHDNENGAGNFATTVSVNGGQAVALDTSHFQIVQSLQDLNSHDIRTSNLQGSTSAEPNDGYYTALPYNEGHEGAWIPISNIVANLTAPIPQDSLSVQITGLTAGTQITDGTHWATATNAGSVDITGWTMTALDVLAPVDATGTMTAVIHATATDSLNGLSSSTTQNLVITLDPYTTVTGATGTGTDDKLVGTSGDDVMIGGGGNDLIIGGAGNDAMTGGVGSDVFRWGLNDHGTTTTPAQDTITDWSTALPKNGGDVLDLRDLLVGESHGTNAASGLEGNLTNYIHFEHSGTNTIVDISTAGQHTAGSPASGTDLKIVLEGVDLTNGGTTTDAAIIQDLLKNGKLHTD